MCFCITVYLGARKEMDFALHVREGKFRFFYLLRDIQVQKYFFDFDLINKFTVHSGLFQPQEDL